MEKKRVHLELPVGEVPEGHEDWLSPILEESDPTKGAEMLLVQMRCVGVSQRAGGFVDVSLAAGGEDAGAKAELRVPPGFFQPGKSYWIAVADDAVGSPPDETEGEP